MKPPYRALLVLRCLFALGLAAISGCGQAEPPSTQSGQRPGTQRVVIDGRAFELELALSPEARFQGLSDREHIPADGGMLFVFPTPMRQSFVMRRCLVPIDIIFLDPQGRIVAMHQMKVEPYDTPEDQLKRYGSRWQAQFAIELAGGMLDQLDIRNGDIIPLPTHRLIEQAE